MKLETTTSDDPMRVFPAQLKAARELRGLSQRQLGKLAGCSGANISRYEQGLRIDSVSLPIVVRLAQALRVALPWLLLGEGPRDIDAPVMLVQIDSGAPKRLRELADQLERGFTSATIALV
jgi:transcriptional regulator with XRE-family HTH domain